MIVPSPQIRATVPFQLGDLALMIRPAIMDDLVPMLQLQALAFADKFSSAFGKRGIQRGVAALHQSHQMQGPSSLQGMYVMLAGGEIVGTITLRTVEMRPDDVGLVEQAFLRELGAWGAFRAVHALSQIDHRIGRDEGFISDVAVAEHYRRRGIAQAMMRHSMTLARELGKKRLGLYVSASNHSARALYRNLGFSEGQVRRSWWNALFLGERRWIYMSYNLRETSA